MTITTPTRRWFQFGLRTMFVLITLVAGFVAYHVNWIRQRHDFLKIEGVWDFSSQSRPSAPGMLWMFGEEGIANLIVMESSKADFAIAESLFPEAACNHTPVILDDFHQNLPEPNAVPRDRD